MAHIVLAALPALLIVIVEFASGGRVAGVIRSTAKLPPLDVFRFSLSFLSPDKRVRGCLLHP